MKHLTSKEYTGTGTVAKGVPFPPELLDDRTIRFVVSTSAVDREGDVVDQSGWDLTDYKMNPVVLFSHDSDEPPVARCIDIGVVNNELVATVQFVPADNPFVGAKAEGLYQLCRDGFIKGVSVGYLPIEWAYSDVREGCKDFHKQSLLEFSICSIPCNQECLVVPDAQKSIVVEDSQETTTLFKSINNSAKTKERWKLYAETLLLINAD